MNLSYFYHLLRYRETPNKKEDDILQKNFGIRMVDLQDGYVADESINVIKSEFGNDAQLTTSNFHNKSDKEKIQKDKQLQDMGLFI